MKLKNQKPREFINPLLSKKSISPTKFNEFKASFAQYRLAIDQQHDAKQSEPNIVTNALKPFVDSLGYVSHSYTQKGPSGIDLAILNNGNPAVVFEVKKHKSADMVSCDKPNTKAFQEAVLYFMREREKGNHSIFHIVITDFYDWFVIDAKDFDRLFWKNKSMRDLFDAHKNPNSLLGDTTKEFYAELHKAIDKLKIDLLDDEYIECAHFETSSVKTDKDLLAIYKLLSPDCLVKAFNPNDANQLNREFYSELLYLLGLEEVAVGTKKTISRAAKKQAGSLFENIANKLGQHHKKNDFDTVINLIIIWVNRILFLKLLESQIVKWTNDPTNKFLSIDKVDQYSKLEELFFEVLAKPIDKRNVKTFNHIPYLNSSLFEINPEETAGITIGALSANAQLEYHAKTVLKDAHSKRKTGSVNALRYLFDFLDAYDFGNDSNDEIADEAKALINASVLGLIFEKINGYKDGSFYTPSFITMYMAREIIQKTVLGKFRAAFADDLKDATWPELKRYCHRRSHKDAFIKSAIALIDKVTVCDPAVGSGHYLVSVMNELVFVKYELGLLQQQGVRVALLNDELHVSLDDEWFEYKRPKSFESPSHLLQKALFVEKQRIIENQLFGVDINRNSTQITKLRLWIELLKHSYYDAQYQLVTLPNIDINIKTGNSLVHRFALSDDIKDKNIKAEIAKYKLKVQEYKENIGSKHAVMAAINGIKETFNKTLKSRHKSTKELDQKLIEYVNLFGFTGLSKELRALAVEATQGQVDLFGVDPEIATKNKAKNTDLKNTVMRLHERVKGLENGAIYHDAFEWRFEFPEVLNESGEYIGFDIVIGNPPYGVGFEQSEKEFLKERFATVHVRTIESFNYFIQIAKTITNADGHFSLIVPSSFLNQTEFEKCRAWLLDTAAPFSNINLGDGVFDDVATPTCIIGFGNNQLDRNFTYADLSCVSRDKLPFSLTNNSQKIDREAIDGNQSSSFIHKPHQSILNKCYKDRPTLKDVTLKVATGISPGLGDAFVLSSDEAKSKNLEQQVVKKLIIGGEINRYYLSPKSGKVIIYFSSKLDVNKFPRIIKHLSAFRQRLEARVETQSGAIPYYVMLRPRIESLFTAPKILIRQTANRIMAAYDDDQWYCLKSGLIVQLKEESEFSYLYLLALLNSKLMGFIYRDLVNEDVRIFPEVKPIQLFKLPIEIGTAARRSKIEALASKLMAKKKSDPLYDVQKYEDKIDALIYEHYGLTQDEILTVCDTGSSTEEDFSKIATDATEAEF